MNKDDDIKRILDHAKPDALQAMEALKKANNTIAMLSNQLKIAEARWTEIFIILGTVLNKLGRQITVGKEDMLSLSPNDYQITVEPVEEDDTKIVRLSHISQKD